MIRIEEHCPHCGGNLRWLHGEHLGWHQVCFSCLKPVVSESAHYVSHDKPVEPVILTRALGALADKLRKLQDVTVVICPKREH